MLEILEKAYWKKRIGENVLEKGYLKKHIEKKALGQVDGGRAKALNKEKASPLSVPENTVNSRNSRVKSAYL